MRRGLSPNIAQGREVMDNLPALLLLHAWFLAVAVSWWLNRHGALSRQNYEDYSRSAWTRWLLGGRDEQAYLRQQRTLHRVLGPLFLLLYVLGLLGALGSHQPQAARTAQQAETQRQMPVRLWH